MPLLDCDFFSCMESKASAAPVTRDIHFLVAAVAQKSSCCLQRSSSACTLDDDILFLAGRLSQRTSPKKKSNITLGIRQMLNHQESFILHLNANLSSFYIKVRAICLFGEVWGIGPAKALKLYEKGYRTLDDLKHEDSLTNAQKLGLKFFDDIKKRIPRHEVKEMEMLLQKVGEEILPGVAVVCGGSYRRGKASCADLDIVITHPDGESHMGFLPKYIQRLKDINFLREDLVFSIHSTEGTDSGVDTYFGFCTYPGREQRHRIDFKVYPRNSYAFGLIAWTGNDVLNRRLRLLAQSKGYRLDDTGLYLATQSTPGKRAMKSSTSVICNTEKEVFDMLGFPWLEPHERNL